VSPGSGLNLPAGHSLHWVALMAAFANLPAAQAVQELLPVELIWP
jgi:hypothetical protein